ncbi:MAG TPA: hypothetical protein VFP05_06825 [Thermomicrobiales bacterium]|nr:hypothetical protein [Thermomicrobiales bacterium]
MNDYPIYEREVGDQYATSASGGTCRATGEGGHIDIARTRANPGRMVVRKLDLGSGHASIDGVEIPVMKKGQGIAVDAPGGAFTVSFRYRPWHFWVGLAASLASSLRVKRSSCCPAV